MAKHSWKKWVANHNEELRYGRWLYNHRPHPDNSVQYGYYMFEFICMTAIPKRDLKHRPQWGKLQAEKAAKEYNEGYKL